MDTLTAAALVLVLTNISFAVLANHWRRQAKQSERTAMDLALYASTVEQKTHAKGWSVGVKQGTGGMYRSALMANANDDVLAALRATGCRLLNEPSAFEEPIVQVPDLVI